MSRLEVSSRQGNIYSITPCHAPYWLMVLLGSAPAKLLMQVEEVCIWFPCLRRGLEYNIGFLCRSHPFLAQIHPHLPHCTYLWSPAFPTSFSTELVWIQVDPLGIMVQQKKIRIKAPYFSCFSTEYFLLGTTYFEMSYFYSDLALSFGHLTFYLALTRVFAC